MVGTGNAQGLTLGADSVATSPASSSHPPAWALSPPVQLPFAAQLETLILGIGLVAFPVLQLHTQRVGCPAGEMVHQLVAQPMLPSWITKALGREEGQGGRMPRRKAMPQAERLDQGLGSLIQNHLV